MTRGVSTTLPTELPARYRTRFAWQLDKRSKVVREVAADLIELWTDLGGYEALSSQQRWLCERVVFIRRRVRFMAKSQLFQPGLANYIFSHGGVFPIRRGHHDEDAFE